MYYVPGTRLSILCGLYHAHRAVKQVLSLALSTEDRDSERSRHLVRITQPVCTRHGVPMMFKLTPKSSARRFKWWTGSSTNQDQYLVCRGLAPSDINGCGGNIQLRSTCVANNPVIQFWWCPHIANKLSDTNWLSYNAVQFWQMQLNPTLST